MRRWLLIALACGSVDCRRHHAYQDDVEPVAPAAEGPPPAAEGRPTTVAPSTAAPRGAPMPDGGTINGDPRGPRAAVFTQVTQTALPRLQACFDAAAAQLPEGQTLVSVHYFVEPPGYTGAVCACLPDPTGANGENGHI